MAKDEKKSALRFIPEAEEDVPSTQPPPEESAIEYPPRRCGWVVDSHDARDHSSHSMLGAAFNLPSEAMLLVNSVRRVNDQTGSSCVGNAIGKAFDTRLRHLGFQPPEPSYQALYTMGRRRGRPGERLTDEGSVARDVMMTVRDQGIASFEQWPDDYATINDDVPFDVLANASRLLVMQFSKVMAVGDSRPDAVANALSKGFPVPFGFECDSAIFNYAGGTLQGHGPENRGGHMVCAMGYRQNDHRQREFCILNSWGTGWGDKGYFWVSDAWLSNDRCRDFYVAEVRLG